MNYLYGSMQREFEYKNVNVSNEKLELIEKMTDILTELGDTMGFDELDYEVNQGECELTIICNELIIRTAEDRALYDVIEMADSFSCKQVPMPDIKDFGISITLAVNI